MWEEFYKKLSTNFLESFPALQSYSKDIPFQRLVSPHTITLPQTVIDKIAAVISKLFQISRQEEFVHSLELNASENEVYCAKANNLSVLMGYDFHYDGNELKLIEINTNSSGFLFCDQLYQHHDIDNPFPFALQNLQESFAKEMTFSSSPCPKVVIIDENPMEQKMAVEFVMYQHLFETWGTAADIADYRELTLKNNMLHYNGNLVDFIYNRYCDFLLTKPSSENLRKAYLNGSCVFSPHPREYLLLADKRRLSDFAKFTKDQEVINTILKSWLASDFANKEDLWQQRKKLFFKPAQSYGGKAAFRGSSISRKMFEKSVGDDTLVQEYSPPGTLEVDGNTGLESWKYDLRAFAYGPKVQLLAARLYKGQVTNFSSQFGGFAPVVSR